MKPTKDAVTPLMRQYEKVKSKYPNVIVLFRVGDFFEAFNDDAKTVSAALNIVLTRRSNGASGDTPMAGFPHHALDNYMTKLVRQGFKVAVCEQMEDPKFARGIVKRDVTEIVTPGIAFSDKLLDTKRNNFLASLHFSKDNLVGVAFIDVTTAEFQAIEIFQHQLKDVLESIQPSEILISKKQKSRTSDVQALTSLKLAFTEIDEWMFSADYADETLRGHFKTHSMKGFGIEDMKSAQVAAAVILNYLEETQKGKLQYIRKISRFEFSDAILLDPQTKRNLEIIFSIQDGSRDGTLIGVMDKTITAMGARMFKRWISRPLKAVVPIQRRLDAVEELVRKKNLRQDLAEQFKQVADLERLLSKIATGRANPKDLLTLKFTLRQLPKVKDLLRDAESGFLRDLKNELQLMAETTDRIENAISDDAPLAVSDGGVIRDGYNRELDELRKISSSAKDVLLEIEARERKASGIASLKVLYNKVFGYYIEISNANRAKVPPHYEKKQTMVNAERYMIAELKELEEKILNAAEKIIVLEQQLFSDLRVIVADEAEKIQENARIIANMDCLLSLAQCAEDYNYVKPTVTETGNVEIKNGRHPVIERLLPAGDKYVPNDTVFGDEQKILIITGPNMAGKSSYIRQTGLIVMLAQIGSFVPATSAKIGLVDKIFTRVGASDNIAAGESTFLVEMNETANILNNATPQSLILLDEIGRGTSTYDGLSIAWSLTEYIATRIGAKTLFATHYHELSELEQHFPVIKNFNAVVEEIENKIIFLRKIARGSADNSYGIEVAKMAGLPSEVITRAKAILANLENKEQTQGTIQSPAKPREDEFQISLFEAGDTKLKAALQTLDINRLTPVEALLKLAELKKMVD
jgi:DNA mismatch repair protein MutS